MREDRLLVTSNLSELDATPFRRGFAAFLTGAVSDGSFVITPAEERSTPSIINKPLTQEGSTATIRMIPEGQKGDHE